MPQAHRPCSSQGLQAVRGFVYSTYENVVLLLTSDFLGFVSKPASSEVGTFLSIPQKANRNTE